MKEYDVIVAGGGTAGAVAAISAARAGLSTLVIEKFTALGGTQTFGLVTPLMEPRVPGCEFVSSAIGEEIRAELEATGNCDWMWFDPCMLKVILENKVLEAGAEILYDTSVIAVDNNNGVIEGITIHNSDGVQKIKAKRYIDCTGDAHVAEMAGAKLMSGNKDGINQSVSLRFEMANVDVEKVGEYLRSTGQKVDTTGSRVQINAVDKAYSKDIKVKAMKAYEEGRLEKLETTHLQMFSVPGRPGAINFNSPETGAGKNVSSALEKTKRLIQGRKAIMRLAAFMKDEIPGFENAYISEIAPMLGIRESKRIKAVYEYDFEDVAERRRFDDAILKSAYPIDVHGAANESGRTLDYKECAPEEEYFEYPYRSIIPQGFDNLLVCGRCAGSDFYSQSALRVQFACQAMGEAAGIASKLSIDSGKPFYEVDGKMVRLEMRKRGSML